MTCHATPRSYCKFDNKCFATGQSSSKFYWVLYRKKSLRKKKKKTNFAPEKNKTVGCTASRPGIFLFWNIKPDLCVSAFTYGVHFIFQDDRHRRLIQHIEIQILRFLSIKKKKTAQAPDVLVPQARPPTRIHLHIQYTPPIHPPPDPPTKKKQSYHTTVVVRNWRMIWIKTKAHLLVAEPGLALDGHTLADHEEIFLALLLQVSQTTGMCVALELLSPPNDALQPIIIIHYICIKLVVFAFWAPTIAWYITVHKIRFSFSFLSANHCTIHWHCIKLVFVVVFWAPTIAVAVTPKPAGGGGGHQSVLLISPKGKKKKRCRRG